MILELVGVLGAGVVGLFAFAATRPGQFRIERSTTVRAPAERAYGQVADFRAWAAWSPWEKHDPAMTKSYDGATSGLGAKYSWKGNSKVGQGEMEITAAEPSRRLGIRLHFIVPFEATNQAEFSFEPAGTETKVTWAMTGTRNLPMKVAHMLFNIEKMLSKDFDTGLAGIKAAVER